MRVRGDFAEGRDHALHDADGVHLGGPVRRQNPQPVREPRDRAAAPVGDVEAVRDRHGARADLVDQLRDGADDADRPQGVLARRDRHTSERTRGEERARVACHELDPPPT